MQGVLEASKILEKVICPALQALDIVMAVGMAAIPPPGKAITSGMGEAGILSRFLSIANKTSGRRSTSKGLQVRIRSTRRGARMGRLLPRWSEFCRASRVSLPAQVAF
jgi:hypothetical protein